MQTFQSRQILAIIKTKFSSENAILTSRCKNKLDPQFAAFVFVLFLCRANCKLIVSEASPEI